MARRCWPSASVPTTPRRRTSSGKSLPLRRKRASLACRSRWSSTGSVITAAVPTASFFDYWTGSGIPARPSWCTAHSGSFCGPSKPGLRNSRLLRTSFATTPSVVTPWTGERSCATAGPSTRCWRSNAGKRSTGLRTVFGPTPGRSRTRGEPCCSTSSTTSWPGPRSGAPPKTRTALWTACSTTLTGRRSSSCDGWRPKSPCRGRKADWSCSTRGRGLCARRSSSSTRTRLEQSRCSSKRRGARSCRFSRCGGPTSPVCRVPAG